MAEGIAFGVSMMRMTAEGGVGCFTIGAAPHTVQAAMMSALPKLYAFLCPPQSSHDTADSLARPTGRAGF
jgi:hypothetical protein